MFDLKHVVNKLMEVVNNVTHIFIHPKLLSGKIRLRINRETRETQHNP